MKCTLLHQNLLRGLTRVGKAGQTKTQMPILQNTLLSVKDGGLSLTTTNTEITIKTQILGKVEKEGGICVPTRLLIELISSFPEGNVVFETKENDLLISCGGFHAEIPGIDVQEFPPVPEKQAKGNTIEKNTFLTSLKSVLFSAATDEGRPILAGVKIQTQGKKAFLVTTDGYRLSLKEMVIGTEEVLDLIVPSRALFEVVRIGEEEKDEKNLVFTRAKDGQLGFYIGDTEIYTRAIDGAYPNYEKIIPKTIGTSVVFEKEQFLRAVKSASIFARDNANIIRICVEDQHVVISANTPAVGQSKIDVEAKIKGEGGEIAFNSRFLLEFLGVISTKNILFEMTGSLNPGVFKLEGDSSYLHIIMPVRVQS